MALRELELLGNFKISGEAREASFILRALSRGAPSILLLDGDLTYQRPGLVRKIQRRHPHLKVLLLEGSDPRADLGGAIRDAHAFLDRSQPLGSVLRQLARLSPSA